MRKAAMILAIFSILVIGAASAWADNQADAKTMVDKALAMVKEKGLDATLAAINDKNGPFVKGELYIFVGDTEKVANVVHPINPALVGKDFSKIKDVKGKLFYLEFVNTAKTGSGWVEYWWPKPNAKEASLKVTYVAGVPNSKLFFACGYYK